MDKPDDSVAAARAELLSNLATLRRAVSTTTTLTTVLDDGWFDAVEAEITIANSRRNGAVMRRGRPISAGLAARNRHLNGLSTFRVVSRSAWAAFVPGVLPRPNVCATNAFGMGIDRPDVEARRRRIDPFVILHDRTLAATAVALPRSTAELEAIKLTGV